MKKKVKCIFVCLLLISTAIVIFPDDLDVEATFEEGGQKGGKEEGIGLDYDYIWNITEDLSDIVKSTSIYPPGTLAKGRAFGTNGERWAADYIMEDEMIDLGLYNVTLEQMSNINSEFPFTMLNLTSKLEVMSKGIKINDTEDISSECHIRPRWNFTCLQGIGVPIPSKDTLTYNCSHSNLAVEHRPYDVHSNIESWICNNTNEILTNDSINDLGSLLQFLLSQFEKNHSFTFEDWVEYPENASQHSWYESYNANLGRGNFTEYIFIDEDPSFNPNAKIPAYYDLLDDLINITNKAFSKIDVNVGADLIEMLLWYFFSKVPNTANCTGILLYDFNDHAFNMDYRWFFPLPTLYINGTIGNQINNSVDTYNITYWVDQNWTESVESYNVIGQINGTNSDETVIISSLYDSWWDQGAGDSAVGMATVLAMAKYFKDNDITPKCNVKFIAFGGEEYSMRGAYYYEAAHPDENITTVIDLNQLGLNQTDPRLNLSIYNNNQSINATIWEIAQGTDYTERTGDTSDFLTLNRSGWVSNDRAFGKAKNRSINTICFVKTNGPWTFHHRDGEEHTEGDVLKNVNREDVNVTTEMIWNVTKYFTVNPDCWFENVSYEDIDMEDDGDMLPDSIKATFTINTVLPHDLAMVNASLNDKATGENVSNIKINYTVTSDGKEGNITVSIPEHPDEGEYCLYLELYNSTGIINTVLGIGGNNVNDTDNSSFFQLFHPFGYTTIGDNTQTLEDKIVGSNFTVHEYGLANNLTAYIKTSGFTYPAPKYKCMIYRQNNSKLIGVTEEKDFGTKWVDPTMNWVVFNFSSSIVLIKDVKYILTCWSDSSKAKISYDLHSVTKFLRGRSTNENYGNPPDPVNWTQNQSRFYSIYCSYTADILVNPINEWWNLFGVPFNGSVSKYDLIIKYDGNDYTWMEAVSNNIITNFVYSYNRSSQSYNLVNSLNPGYGYWVYSYYDCDIVLPSDNIGGCSYMGDLSYQWNLVSVLFNSSVDNEDINVLYNGTFYSWDEASTGNNPTGQRIIIPFLYGWDEINQRYVLCSAFEPGRGYWMFAYDNCALFLNSTCGGRGVGGDRGEARWEVMINFTEPGGGNTDVYFGEDTYFSDGQDDDDVPLAPASKTPYIRSWFDNNQIFPYDKLYKDCRENEDTYKEWNLSVLWKPGNSSSTTMNITWDPEDVNLSEYSSVELYVEGDERPVADMLSDSYYSYSASADTAKEFQIICEA